MAGKNTFKYGKHDSRKAVMVKELELSDEEWKSLEKIADDYKFDKIQRDEINHKLSMIAAGKKWAGTNANAQDIKRTLSSLSKLNADDAVRAVRNCDATTIAQLDPVTWNVLNLKKLADNVTGEQVIEASKIALLNLPENKGGRPNATHLAGLAKYCREIWAMTKHPQQKAWVNDAYGSATPIVEFSAILFKKLKNTDHDKSDIAKLLNLYG